MRTTRFSPLPSLRHRNAMMLGRPAGLEPTISGVTIRRLDQLDYGQQLEIRTGIEPVYAVLQTAPWPFGHRIVKFTRQPLFPFPPIRRLS